MNLWETIANSYSGYFNYLLSEIMRPSWHNYFYALIAVSLFFLSIEWIKPWRKDQAKFRKDFWLDFFYMFFNFFLFSLIIYNAASDVIVNLFNDGIKGFIGFDLQASNPMRNWPLWAILIVGFVVRDFVQWWTHRLLHASPRLWEFHKVHHSVEEMGFAAHLRYHWMETVVYRAIEYIPLALLGIGLYDFFIIHIFSLAIGHYNHSNLSVSKFITGGILGFLLGMMMISGAYEINIISPEMSLLYKVLVVVGCSVAGIIVLGPVMKIVFNHPEMHIWHHAKALPEDRLKGVNFGLSLAIWDYLFGTVYMPHSGRDITLGFPGDESFPKDFLHQVTHGFQSIKED